MLDGHETPQVGLLKNESRVDKLDLEPPES